MVKEVSIGGTKYTLKASVGTMKDFKQVFDKDYTDAISRFVNAEKEANTIKTEDRSTYWLSKIAELNEDILQFAYVMILEAKQKGLNKNFNYSSYDEWISDIERIDVNSFLGVLEIASSIFQGALHK